MFYISPFCCVCLNFKEKCKNIQDFDYDNIRLLDKINYCVENHTFKTEEIPLHICFNCNHNLRIAYRFRKQYLKSSSYINNYFNQLKNVATPKKNRYNELNLSLVKVDEFHSDDAQRKNTTTKATKFGTETNKALPKRKLEEISARRKTQEFLQSTTNEESNSRIENRAEDTSLEREFLKSGSKTQFRNLQNEKSRRINKEITNGENSQCPNELPTSNYVKSTRSTTEENSHSLIQNKETTILGEEIASEDSGDLAGDEEDSEYLPEDEEDFLSEEEEFLSEEEDFLSEEITSIDDLLRTEMEITAEEESVEVKHEPSNSDEDTILLNPSDAGNELLDTFNQEGFPKGCSDEETIDQYDPDDVNGSPLREEGPDKGLQDDSKMHEVINKLVPNADINNDLRDQINLHNLKVNGMQSNNENTVDQVNARQLSKDLNQNTMDEHSQEINVASQEKDQHGQKKKLQSAEDLHDVSVVNPVVQELDKLPTKNGNRHNFSGIFKRRKLDLEVTQHINSDINRDSLRDDDKSSQENDAPNKTTNTDKETLLLSENSDNFLSDISSGSNWSDESELLRRFGDESNLSQIFINLQESEWMTQARKNNHDCYKELEMDLHLKKYRNPERERSPEEVLINQVTGEEFSQSIETTQSHRKNSKDNNNSSSKKLLLDLHLGIRRTFEEDQLTKEVFKSQTIREESNQNAKTTPHYRKNNGSSSLKRLLVNSHLETRKISEKDLQPKTKSRHHITGKKSIQNTEISENHRKNNKEGNGISSSKTLLLESHPDIRKTFEKDQPPKEAFRSQTMEKGTNQSTKITQNYTKTKKEHNNSSSSNKLLLDSHLGMRKTLENDQPPKESFRSQTTGEESNHSPKTTQDCNTTNKDDKCSTDHKSNSSSKKLQLDSNSAMRKIPKKNFAPGDMPRSQVLQKEVNHEFKTAEHISKSTKETVSKSGSKDRSSLSRSQTLQSETNHDFRTVEDTSKSTKEAGDKSGSKDHLSSRKLLDPHINPQRNSETSPDKEINHEFNISKSTKETVAKSGSKDQPSSRKLLNMYSKTGRHLPDEVRDKESHSSGSTKPTAPSKKTVDKDSTKRLRPKKVDTSTITSPPGITAHPPEEYRQNPHKDPPIAHSKVPKAPKGKVENSKDPHECPVCKKPFKEYASMKQHLWRQHTAERKYQCDICDKMFLQAYGLELHLRSHRGEKRHVCSVCGRRYSQRQSLVQHMELHNGGRKFKYHCQLCGKKFISRPGYKQHLIVHSGVKAHKCSTCGRAFSLKGELIRHTRTHTGERLHQCPICLKRYTSKFILKQHQMRHANEKNFKCHLCDKGFTLVTYLRQHLKRHRGVRNHKCSICGACFSSSGHAKRHMKVHDTSKPYACELCQKRFYQEVSRDRHVRNHRKNKILS